MKLFDSEDYASLTVASFDHFDIERDFDNRTMYCEADVSEMTGWNAHIVGEQIIAGSFPEALNPGSRSRVWSKSVVDTAFAKMIASEPTAEEEAKISQHRDIYDLAYEEALPITRSTIEIDITERIEKEAEAIADAEVSGETDEETREHAWDHYYHIALDDIRAWMIEEKAEMHARWKARQAVRWLK